jgi:hypothetical protein
MYDAAKGLEALAAALKLDNEALKGLSLAVDG